MSDSAPVTTHISGECPNLWRLLRGDYSDLAIHYRKCNTCQTELRLFGTYGRGVALATDADVAWIAEHLRANPVWLEVHRSRKWLEYIHRVEPAIAAILILITLPVSLVVAAIIALLSRRSPLIRHVRVGHHGSRLEMLKFRTMWGPEPLDSAERTGQSTRIKSSDDPRIASRFAAWCRRVSLDELPQLFHILRGEMSLVGSRPLTRAELDQHYGFDALETLSSRPGMTGLWQVSGRSRLKYAQRRRLDLFWTRHASPGLYFKILLRTIPKALGGQDAF